MYDLFSDFEEYKIMVKKYKNNKNNFYFLPKDVKKFIEEKRISYFEYESQLFLILDQGTYGDLFCFSNDFNMPKFRFNKNLYMTVADRNNYNLQNILQMEKKLIQYGAEKMACSYRFSFDLDKNKDEILKLRQKDNEYLENLGIRFVSGRDTKLVPQVHELWKNALPSYSIPFEHINYMNYPEYNVICLIDTNYSVVGVHFLYDINKIRETRHLVISPMFRRKGLGSIMVRHAICDAVANGIRNYRTWIAEDNTSSLSMHKGFDQNDIISYKYLFKSVESL